MMRVELRAQTGQLSQLGSGRRRLKKVGSGRLFSGKGPRRRYRLVVFLQLQDFLNRMRFYRQLNRFILSKQDEILQTIEQIYSFSFYYNVCFSCMLSLLFVTWTRLFWKFVSYLQKYNRVLLHSFKDKKYLVEEYQILTFNRGIKKGPRGSLKSNPFWVPLYDDEVLSPHFCIYCIH